MTEDPKPALLPCPFCGGTDLSLEDARDFISCGTCWTEGPVTLGAGTAHNIERWNARATLDAAIAQARRDALEEAARVCDVTPPYPFRASIEAAHAIRALADKPAGER